MKDWVGHLLLCSITISARKRSSGANNILIQRVIIVLAILFFLNKPKVNN